MFTLDFDKNIVFLVDIDGVLRDNLGIMVNLYNKQFNTSLKPEDVVFYDTSKSFPLIRQELGENPQDWFFRDRSEEIFYKAPAFKNAKDNVDKLRKIGKVVIATYQKSLENKIHTLKWLNDQEIEYDGIFFGKEKEHVECDFIIDDNIDFIVASRAKCRIVIDAPYNKMPMMALKENSKCDCIARFDSFDSFVNEITSTVDVVKKLGLKIFQ